MKALIAVTDEQTRQFLFRPEVLQRLQGLCEVSFLEAGGLLRDQISGQDIVVTSWGSPRLTEEVLEAADALRLFAHAAGTVVPYTDGCIFERGVRVVHANVALARSTAECAVMLMLAGAWRIKEQMSKARMGVWSELQQVKPPGLHGSTVGLIGYGEISREVIRLLAPFSCRVLMHSPYCTAEEAARLGIELCGLAELLQQSDVVSLHDTLTEQTRGMLGAAELSRMKEGALLVNTARGPLVREEALREQVKSGRIYAALDVYEEEPLPPGSEWTTYEHVIATPHCGGYSDYWTNRISTLIVDDIERFIQGEPLRYEVTKERYARSTIK
ncbi:hypothetical protein PA598K_05851 [Paenibacillus sp. 598K]|uniref:hydroxyacid dehydrogenase n=1 Tax=Paenibacillus sp. 598K TaxID=1117987 RepID=UPI000FFAD051|nr:hydroxyacid dehydrogenase [Paenibacillus sp. 598K]GBF77308.1 hypothetical protein PA598K_05851 [Paenibacillus sp. 598K]